LPNATGNHELNVFIRFMSVNRSAAAGLSAPATLYFNTYTYAPSLNCAFDGLAGCDAPAHFYSAVLDNHFFWKGTWEEEGRMSLDLPSPAEVNGTYLMQQASHGIVLDMIVRKDTVWPRYGTMPGYEQPGMGGHGFQVRYSSR